MASATNFSPKPFVTPPHSPSKFYRTASRSPSKFAEFESSQQSVPFYSSSTSSLTTSEARPLNGRAIPLTQQSSGYENVISEVSFFSASEDCSSDRTSDAYVTTPRDKEDTYVMEAIAPNLSRVGFGSGYLSSTSLRSSDDSYVTPTVDPTHSRVGFESGYLPSLDIQTQAGQPSTLKKPKLKLDPKTPSKDQLWQNIQEFASEYLSPEKSPQNRDLVVTTIDGVPLFKLDSTFVCPAGTELGAGYTRKAQLALTTKKGSPASSSQDWIVLSTQKIKTDKQFKIAQSEDKILKKVKEKLELYPFTKGIFKFQNVFYRKDGTGEMTQFLLSDYYNGGDLSAHISQIPQASVPKIMYELIDAVCFLHLIAFIFHSDIKDANVLVRFNSLGEIEEVGLGDFGFSCNMEDPQDLFYKNGDAATISTEFSLKRSMHRHKLKTTLGSNNASSSTTSQTTELKGLPLTDEIYKEDVYALGVLFEKLCKNFPNHPYKLLINTMKTPANARRPGIAHIKEMFSQIHPEFTFQYNKQSAI